MTATTCVKKSDSFAYLARIPSSYSDGYFFNFIPRAQIRSQKYGELIADLACVWTDYTTRVLAVQCIDTSQWPVGNAVMDIQFQRPTDGYTISTDTVNVVIEQDITQ